MDEKTMVADALVGINGELKMFGDMIPQTENKALAALAGHLGIQREEIACIGDGENDLSMFASSGLKIAMGNAVDRLKIQADYIAETNRNDGAAKAIEQYIL